MVYRLNNDHRLFDLPRLAGPLCPPPNRARLTAGQNIFSRPITAGPMRPPIVLVAPESLLPAERQLSPAIMPARISYRPKPRPIMKLAAAAAGGAALLLLPATALAGTGLFAATASLFASMGPAGWIGAAAGAYLTGKLLIGKYREVQPANYRSKNMKLNVGNPTLRKLFKTLVLPAWGATMIFGGLLSYAQVIEGGIGIFSLGLCGLVAAKPLITMLFRAGRDIKQAIEFWRRGVQRHLPKHSLIAELATDLMGAPAWLATVAVEVLLGKTYATQTIAMLLDLPGQLVATVTSLAGWLHMAEYVLAAGVIVGAARYLYGWTKAVLAKFPDELPARATSSLRWGACGALAGAAIFLLNPGQVVANLITFAVTLAFSHITIHSLLSQEGGIRQAAKKQPVFDLESLIADVRGARGATRTVLRPAMGDSMIDSWISGYLMMIMSEGANWVLKGVDGTTNTTTILQKSQEMIERLLKRDGAIIRKIIKDGYTSVKAAASARESEDRLAEVFDNLARLLEDPTYPEAGGHPLAWGDLKTRSGLSYLKDGVFCAGMPDGSAPNGRGDQDVRVHGEHIRFTARIFREKARRLRAHQVKNASLKSQQGKDIDKLEAAYRRAHPLIDSHPRCFWTTFWTTSMPDPNNVKQSGVDEFLQMQADFVGVFDVVVMTADGRIHDWPVPLTVVKDFKPDHKSLRALDSREELDEYLCVGWYQRAVHDIGNSLCPIAYIDNSAHYNKYKRLHDSGVITDGEFLHLYPTAEVTRVPTLKSEPQLDEYGGQGLFEEQEFYDVVYKNGARLRVFADGSHKTIGATSCPLPPDAPALLMLPGTERHNFVARTLRANRDGDIFRGIALNGEIRNCLADGTVPHPFGGNFTDNKYLMPRWHFMYPTEYFSISDADQTDIIVSNLRLFHTRKAPHLRVMFTRPRREELPFSADMLEKPEDSLLEVGIATGWMTLKIKLTEKNAAGKNKMLYVPLNMNKEDPRTFGGELWRYIDEDQPLEIVRDAKGKARALKIHYRGSAMFDPAFAEAVKNTTLMAGGKYNRRESVEEVPLPLEMGDLADGIEEIRINPERFGEVGGPRPFADYFFTRRAQAGDELLVTDKKRERFLTERVADMLTFGKIALMSRTEIEHWQMVMPKGAPTAKDEYPWTDDNGYVHMKMSSEEAEQLMGSKFMGKEKGGIIGWSPLWQGKEQPTYRELDKELIIYVKHFELLCQEAYDQYAYRRFMPDKFRNYFDPNEVAFAAPRKKQ
ncbi:MAG: hypothetical protein JW873_06385 [Candidatus Saganbacteria bacterium]|nr:hypothetical protein [Candidatus Saganbacteria bacterium]